MLGVVSPPGTLFGIGACLILAGAATASVVTMLPHTEVFDATEAVKVTNDGGEAPGADKSPRPSPKSRGYGSTAATADASWEARKRASLDCATDSSSVSNRFGAVGPAHIRSLSKNTDNTNYHKDLAPGVSGGKGANGGGRACQEDQSLLYQGDVGSGGGGGSSGSMKRIFK